jgi:hypothetical protein
MTATVSPTHHPRHRVTGHSPPVSAGRMFLHGALSRGNDPPLLLPALPAAASSRGRGRDESPRYPSQEWIANTRRKRHVGPSDRMVVCVCLSSCGVVLLLIVLLGLAVLWQGCSFVANHWSRHYVLVPEEDLRSEDHRRLAISTPSADHPHPKVVWLMSFPNRYAWSWVLLRTMFLSFFILLPQLYLSFVGPAVRRLSFT